METKNTPDISGISPSEGPLGTKITIRGDNFGVNANDLISVVVCDIDCTKRAQWISSRKLVCVIYSNTLNTGVFGSIKIKTLSGGEAESDLKFSITFNKLKPLTESAIWIEEEISSVFLDPLGVLDVDIKEIACEPDPLGILNPNTLASGPQIFHENYAQFSSKLADDSFHPIKFLLDRHSQTSYENLRKATHTTLKRMNISSNSAQSSQFSTQAPMVIDVISDMFRLVKSNTDSRINSKEELTIAVTSLSTRVAAYFYHLSDIYSRRTSLMRFLSTYNNYSKSFILPKTIELTMKYKSSYFQTLQHCLEFKQVNINNFEQNQSLYTLISNKINSFIDDTILNLHVVFPAQIDVFIDFYNKVKKINPEKEYALIFIKTHQNWVKNQFMAAEYSLKSVKSFLETDYLIHISTLLQFRSELVKFIISSILFYKKEIELDLLFILSYCDENSVKYRGSYGGVFLDLVEESRNFLKWFFGILSALLHDSSSDKTLNLLIILKSGALSEVFSALYSTFLSIKSYNTRLQKYVHSDKQISFFSDFSIIYNSFLYDCFIVLKKHYINKITEAISIVPKTHNLYYKEYYSEHSLCVYSTMYEWVTIFRDLFSNIYCYSSLRKVEDLFPSDFLTMSLKNSFDIFILNNNLSVTTMVIYLDHVNSVINHIKSNFMSCQVFQHGWDGNEQSINKNQIFDKLKSDIDECEKFYSIRMLPKISNLLAVNLLSVIQEMYLSKNSGQSSFYKNFLKLVLKIREACITLNLLTYKSIIQEICIVIVNHVNNNIKVDDAKAASRLLINLRVIGVFAWYIGGEKIEKYEETFQIFKEKTGVSDIHVEKIIEKHKHTLNILRIASDH